MTLDERRQHEFDTYRRLYEQFKYGAETDRHRTTRIFLLMAMHVREVTSWLDVGSGAFDLSDVFPAIVRTDPAFGGVPMHRVSELGTFALVTAFDVLEHLLPEELDECLRELQRAATCRIVVSVGTSESHWGGHRCHQTVMPAEAWRERLAGIWGEPVRTWFPGANWNPFFVWQRGGDGLYVAPNLGSGTPRRKAGEDDSPVG